MDETGKTFNIKIYKAADSFLYLPVYIAQELEIFQTVLKPVLNGRSLSVDFDPKHYVGDGDKKAILEMLKNDADDTVAIAIGSPVAFLDFDNINDVPEDVKIVGAVIDKPTFWAVSKEPKNMEFITDFKGKFTNIICPNEDYITVHYFGQKVKDICKDEKQKLDFVKFGTEITALAKRSADTVAITADIADLAVTITSDRQMGHMNHQFSKSQGEFLTTGIITSKKSCENFPEIVEKIIESIQMSIAILYSSEKTAKTVCAQIANAKENFQKQFKNEMSADSLPIEKTIELMYDEKFYPTDDLRISKGSWLKAVESLTSIQKWKKEDIEKVKTTSFAKYVDNSFMLKSITKRAGIDLDTSKDKCKKDTNNCSHLKELEKNHTAELLEKNYCKKETCPYKIKYNDAKWLFDIVAFFKKHGIILFILGIIVLLVVFLIVSIVTDIEQKTLTIIGIVVGVLGVAGTMWGVIYAKHTPQKKQGENEKQ